MNIAVVIPAYNEEKTVGEVVRRVLESKRQLGNFQPFGWTPEIRCIIVDDGSADHTAEVARVAGATVLSHPINRGLGAALSTGIEGALRLMHNAPQPPLTLRGGGGVVVTLDADGQHDPSEIAQMIQPILEGKAEGVIGSRFVARPPSGGGLATTMPLLRIGANFCGNVVTWLLFGIWVSDSQSGFRAFSAEAAARLQLRTSTMEVSSEIIREIARLKLKMIEVPVTARYTEYSLSKGQGFLRGLETLWKLVVLRFFR